MRLYLHKVISFYSCEFSSVYVFSFVFIKVISEFFNFLKKLIQRNITVSSSSVTPGPSLSVGPVTLTWAGSSQPQRRTCPLHDSGVWHALPCYPESHRVRERSLGTTRVSSACDWCLLSIFKALYLVESILYKIIKLGPSVVELLYYSPCITVLIINPSYLR